MTWCGFVGDITINLERVALTQLINGQIGRYDPADVENRHDTHQGRELAMAR